MKDAALETDWKPVMDNDGYLPLEDYGIIGDGATAALVGRDGTIAWLCVPRFDSPPIFCSLLGATQGGRFAVTPEHALESRQYYEPDTAVLITEIRTKYGMLRITDAMTFRSGADLSENTRSSGQALVRRMECLQGRVAITMTLQPYGDAEAEPRADGLAVRCRTNPDLTLHLRADIPLTGLHTRLVLDRGRRIALILHWGATGCDCHRPGADELLRETQQAWAAWARHIRYEGPHPTWIRRSAITLKLLNQFETGAIIAAPTSSLPEEIGGVRNWDYRYTWIRDASLSVYALMRIGLIKEAAGFLRWVLELNHQEGHPFVAYDLAGHRPPEETHDPRLPGYRCSNPVRWGTASARQQQHDAYGDICDCAYQWAQHHGDITQAHWQQLHQFVERTRQIWRQPDHGIWEVRTQSRRFTYSAGLCHVALDRGAILAEQFKHPANVEAWRKEADEIRRVILEEAWNPRMRSLMGYIGGDVLDASVLALPLRHVIAADDSRMVATVEAVVRHLGAGSGLLYRYRPEELHDGIEGREGAFVLCSFWLVDNLVEQGRFDEAMDLFDSLHGRANPLGLLSEEIDPSSGAFLGNYPQGLSHIGVISSGVRLVAAQGR